MKDLVKCANWNCSSEGISVQVGDWANWVEAFIYTAHIKTPSSLAQTLSLSFLPLLILLLCFSLLSFSHPLLPLPLLPPSTHILTNFPLHSSTLQSMDNSHVALVSLKLDADMFDPFRCDRNMVLGINIEKWALTMLRSPTLYLFYNISAVMWYLFGSTREAVSLHCVTHNIVGIVVALTNFVSKPDGHLQCCPPLWLWPAAGTRPTGMNCGGLVFRYSTSQNVHE